MNGSRAALWLVPGALLLLPACQQQMAEQPSYRPLDPAAFFPDGRSARPLVAGTVPRGLPLPDSRLLSGLNPRPPTVTTGVGAAGMGGDVLGMVGRLAAAPSPVADYVTKFPFPITRAALERGQQRYLIYCAVCHGPTGLGNGKIVERGYLKPPNYYTDHSRGMQRRGYKVLLRDMPVGYYFEVVSKGYGGMPDYAGQIAPEDMWKIIAYVRAMQISRHVPLQELPDPLQQQARQKALEGNP